MQPRCRLGRGAFAFVIVAMLACMFVLGSTVVHKAEHARAPITSGNGPALEVMPSLQGESANQYLKEHGSYESLRAAVTAARFGLKWQERSPFGDEGGGYIGMSHVQNLNVWFTNEGVTIRPTLSDEAHAKTWRLQMKLKAYGYGEQLISAPPVISSNVKDNRIEYERGDCRLPIADRRFENLDLVKANSAISPLSSLRQSTLIEWYENRAAGIEQGFKLNARPEHRGDHVEPLHLVVALTGDLHARAKKDGSGIELQRREGGDAVLSYGELVAQDSSGHSLTARMETNATGTEIALTVDDRGATYPIEVDPITATLEQKLTKPFITNAGSEFGDAVAISRDVAMVGAWVEDIGTAVDIGRIYFFTRSGSTWTSKYATTLTTSSSASSAQCGWNLALSDDGTRAAFGCPGYNLNSGFAEFLQTDNNWSSASGVTIVPTGAKVPKQGDRYGEGIALNNDIVSVGAPLADDPFSTHVDVGEIHFWVINRNLQITGQYSEDSRLPEGAHFGASLAVSFDKLIVGIPGWNSQGAIQMYDLMPASDGTLAWSREGTLLTGEAGDLFGYSVAISGNTAVVGAPLDDNAKGTDAGAAYILVRNNTGNWSRQQKLIASDGIDQDHFGQSVAIDGGTIVVGSPYYGSKTFIGTRGNGRAYVFTRNVNVWSEQGVFSALFDGAPGDKFGVAAGVSYDTVISGAEHAAPNGISDAGAAYVHRLSCVAPAFFQALDVAGDTSGSVCPGGTITLVDSLHFGSDVRGTEPLSYQWRKNGVNIAGPTPILFDIKNASAADAGSYDFIVSNSCGAEMSTPFTLTVHSFAVFPASINVGTSGTTGTLAVNATGSCPWTAQSNASWITITSGSSGKGNGNVGFTVAANTGVQRTGTMTVAGGTVIFTQDSGCTYSITPLSQNFPASIAAGAVNLTAGTGCLWTASSNSPFLTITSGASGSGNGAVNYSVAANTGPQRSGTMTIAGLTFTVTQDGAPFIFVEEGSNRLAAFDSVTHVRGGFSLTDNYNFSSDHRRRIIFFTTSLGFSQPAQPDISTLSVQVGGFLLPVENVGPITIAGLDSSYIVLRLPDLPPGDWPLTIQARGLNSINSPILTIVASSNSTTEIGRMLDMFKSIDAMAWDNSYSSQLGKFCALR